jgi:hypothetical protein
VFAQPAAMGNRSLLSSVLRWNLMDSLRTRKKALEARESNKLDLVLTYCGDKNGKYWKAIF